MIYGSSLRIDLTADEIRDQFGLFAVMTRPFDGRWLHFFREPVEEVSEALRPLDYEPTDLTEEHRNLGVVHVG